MRVAALCLMSACLASAQFKTTVPLVVAPTAVTDAKSRYVDGLAAEDLVLYDNNVRQPIQLDYEVYPISLVVAIQSNLNSEAMLDKLGGSAILFSQLVAADAGETAVISFSDQVHLRQDFTTDPDALIHAVKRLRVEGDEAAALDGVERALAMLAERRPERRRIILVIAEKRDRSSQAKLPDVVREVQRQNVSVYWLTYSPFLTPFTNRKVKKMKDVEDEKDVGKDKKKDEERAPDDSPPFNLLVPFFELAHLASPNVADLFAQLTGARTINFLKKSGLEEAIQAIGAEVHRQYIVTYQPPAGEPGQFHAIRVAVKDRPDLHARTRTGYWSVQ